MIRILLKGVSCTVQWFMRVVCTVNSVFLGARQVMATAEIAT